MAWTWFFWKKLMPPIVPPIVVPPIVVPAVNTNIMATLDLNAIIQVDFPKDQYYQEEFTKKIIVLHHTVSGKGAQNDIEYWEGTPEKVATAMVVDWQGKMYQLFSSKFWAHHLGTTAANNRILNQQSIGIEIDSWGGLVQNGSHWYPAKWDAQLGKNVANLNVKSIDNVQVYDTAFRGFYGFEKYSDAQIEAVRQLLVYWGGRYNIPLNYNDTMFGISLEALAGKSGVWSHTSYRLDKSDVHPQPELIQMLKSLV
jgi:N-acetyl-anhydromuramyl-L-alanine amidase AmpD